MPSSPVCVDAGVIVRLFVAPESTAIRDLWAQWKNEERQVVAPVLLFYEVTNALYQYQRHSILQADAVLAALEAALRLPIQLYPDTGLHRSAMIVAQQLGLPAAYDAHYVGLAQQLGAELWTTDRSLVNRCRQDWVKLIE